MTDILTTFCNDNELVFTLSHAKNKSKIILRASIWTGTIPVIVGYT